MLAIILASYFMIVLDISVVLTGLPRIESELHFSPADLSWVQTAYTLTFGGLLLLGARAGDLLGRRRVYMAGMALFATASIGVAAAPTALALVAARAAQGIGAAILAPATLALLTTNFAEGPERTRAIALYGAIAGIGASVGLVAGGIIADLLTWRVGFLVNGPIGLVMLALTPRFISEGPRERGAFDLLGAVTSTVGMTALVFGIVHSASAGWVDLVTDGALAVAAVMLGFFLVVEARVAQPILPLRLFSDRHRVSAYASRLLFMGAMSGYWFFTTRVLQGTLGLSPLEAGIAFLPTTIPNLAGALAIPRLSRRVGNGRLLIGGLATGAAGLALLSRVSPDTSYAVGIAVPMILIGAAQGVSLGPLTVAGVARVDPHDAGAASGVVNVAHQLGASLGLGVLVAIAASLSGGTPDSSAGIAHDAGVAFSLGAGFLGAALVLALPLLREPVECAQARDVAPRLAVAGA